MNKISKDLLCTLRKNSRYSLSKFSQEKGLTPKKVHYFYGKIKNKEVEKFVPIMNFEAFGFKRVFVFFKDSPQGLHISSTFKNYFVNNSTRLDRGVLVEYVFFNEAQLKSFIKELKKKGIIFEHYLLEKVIKQEECFALI